MFKLLRTWKAARTAGGDNGNEAEAQAAAPPTEVAADGVTGFPIAAHLSSTGGFPILDWQAAQAWADTVPDARARALAWSELERAWLKHMQCALGAPYRLREANDSLLLSTLEPNVASATLDYMSKTLQRVVRVLDGIAQVSDWGKDILVVFDDADAYYRHVSHVYPSDGEFAASSGMYINAGCGHFASDLARILVSQFSTDWPSFRAFVLSANLADSAAGAAAEHLHLDLGAAVSAILEREPAHGWAPDPTAWHEAPEHGAF